MERWRDGWGIIWGKITERRKLVEIIYKMEVSCFCCFVCWYFGASTRDTPTIKHSEYSKINRNNDDSLQT